MKRYLKWFVAIAALALSVTPLAAAEGLDVMPADAEVPALEMEVSPEATGEEAAPEADAADGDAAGDAVLGAVEPQAAEAEVTLGDEPDAADVAASDVAFAEVAAEPAAEPAASGVAEPAQPAEEAVTEAESAPEPADAPTTQDDAPQVIQFTGPKAKRIPVLAYHKVVTDEEKRLPKYANDDFALSLTVFTRQMNWLRDKQYTAITCEQMYQWRMKQIELPKRSVLITFDDGYASTVENILPVLEARGLRATVFVIGGQSATSDGSRFVTLARIHELQAQGACVEFQSHTWNLHRKNAYQTESYDAFYADAAQQNAVYGFNCIAYPYGKYSKAMIRAYRDNGIRMAFLFGRYNNGYATRKQKLFKMKRVQVLDDMSLRKFKKWCK